MRRLQSFDASYYDFQDAVGRTLLVWGGANVVAGAAAQASGNPFLKQFGMQALVWGAIDAALALLGLRDAAKKRAERSDQAAQARRFRVIVALNVLLDVGYIAGGVALARSGRNERAGMGIGVIVQGAFLLLFDLALVALSGHWARR